MLDIVTIQVTPEEARMIKTALITRAMNYALEEKTESLTVKYNELYRKVSGQTNL